MNIASNSFGCDTQEVIEPKLKRQKTTFSNSDEFLTFFTVNTGNSYRINLNEI